MASPEPRNTIITPVTATPRTGSARGAFFRSLAARGGGGAKIRTGEKRARRNGWPWPGAARAEDAGDGRRLAFILLYIFTALLYARPGDLIPALQALPTAKSVAIIALLAHVYAQYRFSRPFITWTIEVKMIAVMLFLAVLFTPIAASPGDSVKTLSEVFIKVAITFILIISVINTRDRLRAMIKLTVACGAYLAAFAIKNYATGNFTLKGDRIEGLVGGIFGNPNDLAAALNMLVPLAVALALMSAGARRLLYVACALIMSCGVMVTFSRAGFITLAAVSGVMLWKFGRGSRPSVALATLIAAVLLFSTFSGGYRSRLATILDPNSDPSGSALERIELLKRGLDLSIRHPIIGLGMGNFHIYSIREKVAHNGYFETAAELGVIGLLAYLIIILAPLRGLAKIEMETVKSGAGADPEAKYLSIGLQAALIAYLINSFFLSIQYLWYLYYAAGFATAMRLIYAAEKAARTSEDGEAATERRFQFGSLWRPATRKREGSLWPAYRFGGGRAAASFRKEF